MVLDDEANFLSKYLAKNLKTKNLKEWNYAYKVYCKWAHDFIAYKSQGSFKLTLFLDKYDDDGDDVLANDLKVNRSLKQNIQTNMRALKSASSTTRYKWFCYGKGNQEIEALKYNLLE